MNRVLLFIIIGLIFISAISHAHPQQHVPYHWRNVPIGGGGYVLDVYCQPKQKNLIYIRTDVGGFYRWDASGKRWIPLTDAFTADQSNYYGGEGMALDPSNPNIVYIAAGKYTYSSTPGAIFKSYNQGRTWKKLPLSLPMGGNEDHRWGGQRLAVDPFHPQRLLFGSRDSGLWRSVDAGNSWSKVSNFPGRLTNDIGITAIAFNQHTPNAVSAVAYGDAVYQSDDDGVSWRRTLNGPAKVDRLASAVDGALYATHQHGVSEYSHGRWLDVTPPNAINKAFCGLATDSNNAQDVLASEQTDHLKLFQSRDAGKTWTLKKYKVISSVPWYSSSMKQVQYVAGIAYDPRVQGRVWLTDWYAAYRTDNINVNPILLRNHEHGHEELVVFNLLAAPGGPALLSGTADVDGFVHQSLRHFPKHGLGSYYGGSGPTYGYTEGFAWCSTTPNRVVRAGVIPWNNTGGVAVSQDGGRTWTAAAGWDSKIMAARIAISAKDPDDMVVLRVNSGADQVTKDDGQTWRNVSGLPDNLISSVWNWQNPLTADGALPNVFYVYAGSALYKSVDGGASFTVVNSQLPTGGVSLISVPGRAGDLWLAGSSGLYHSINGGGTFRRIASVSHAPLFAIGIHAPGSLLPTLYLDGTLVNGRTGIFRSLNFGKSWQEIDSPDEAIGDVPDCMAGSFQKFGQVFIGTNGRGIFYGTPQTSSLNRK